MEAVSYTDGNDIYTVKPITDTIMLGADAEAALEIVGYDNPTELYKEAMLESILQGLAYEIWKNDGRVGYIYNAVIDEKYIGISINVKGYEAMAIAMKHMFEINDSHKIIFHPHSIGVGAFKSMLLGTSIRNMHNGKNEVVILKKDIVYKGHKVFHYLGLREING
jgi:hypothetical protein